MPTRRVPTKLSASAAIIDAPGLAPDARLALALRHGGFWRKLRATQRSAGVSPAEFRILIKPDLTGFAAGSPAATDPILVERLIDLLHDAGYTQVAVGSAADSSAVWAENRSVLALADLSGYRFVTDAGRSYDVLDLSENLVPAGAAAGEVLSGTQLSTSWLEAHFRIVFAKNKTDQADGYALCVESLLGVLPLVDKDYYYRHRHSAAEVIVELLRHTPVHFGMIDAIVSAHGNGGRQAPTPLATDCIVAATDLQLADYLGAAKMGLDPDVSRIGSAVRRRIPPPIKYTVYGGVGTHQGWRNVHPILLDSTRKRDASVTAQRLVSPWLQSLDATSFPLKSPVDAKINATVAPFFGKLDDDPVAFTTLVSTNLLIAAVTHSVELYRILLDKDALRRVETPLGLDLAQFSPQDYRNTYEELAQLEPLLAGVEEAAVGLRWRYLEKSIVFSYTRTLPVDFDSFVAKVDVSRTIQYLNDYIGGVIVPVEHDAQGRVICQAERNLYLPQPNYIACGGGKPIDVSKLEFVEYEDSHHRMCWKTVKSENDSALHDDGIVTFEREGDTTAVRILGRQLFVLPPFWEAANLDLNPRVQAELVTHAYKTFFDRSLANFEALVEGRDIRIGRPWHVPTDPLDHEPPPIQSLERLLERGAAWAKESFAKVSARSAERSAQIGHVDEDGFVHVKGAHGRAR